MAAIKPILKRIVIQITLIISLVTALVFYMILMPKTSFQGTAPPLQEQEIELQTRLKAHVEFLAQDTNGRNHYLNNSLIPYRDYIIEQFRSYGYRVALHSYPANDITYTNIEVEHLGQQQRQEIIVIGAHYDSVLGVPGANDNASGVAAVLELARLFKDRPLSRTVRFVAFVNEEAPFFQTEAMGSLVYARRCAEKQDTIVGMISLETIGYFVDQPGSQHYPVALLKYLYPSEGNFIAFVSNLTSRSLLRNAIGLFRTQATIPSEGIAAPESIPGIGWSDHWAFWQSDYPAIMVTDTALYRYPHYHRAEDTADKINYEQMTRVVVGMQAVIRGLANS